MRILIVEDYGPLAFLLQSMGHKIGNQVDIVYTLEEALVKLDDLPPCDVILLDLSLLDASPEMAIEAIPKLKEKAKKLVVMTGNPKEQLVFLAMKAGADDYVSKNNPEFSSLIQSYISDLGFYRTLISTRGD